MNTLMQSENQASGEGASRSPQTLLFSTWLLYHVLRLMIRYVTAYSAINPYFYSFMNVLDICSLASNWSSTQRTNTHTSTGTSTSFSIRGSRPASIEQTATFRNRSRSQRLKSQTVGNPTKTGQGTVSHFGLYLFQPRAKRRPSQR